MKEVEKSLILLQVSYLDLVLLHTPAPRKDGAVQKKAMTQEVIDRLPDPQDAEGNENWTQERHDTKVDFLPLAMEATRLSAWQGLELCVERGLVR